MEDLARGVSPLGRIRMGEDQEVMEIIGQYAYHYGQYYRRMARRERRVSNRMAEQWGEQAAVEAREEPVIQRAQNNGSAQPRRSREGTVDSVMTLAASPVLPAELSEEVDPQILQELLQIQDLHAEEVPNQLPPTSMIYSLQISSPHLDSTLALINNRC